MVLLFTAISVSVDAYAAGFAYGMSKRTGVFGAFYAGLITFFACLTAGVFRSFLGGHEKILNIAGGLLLAFTGMKNMLGGREKKDKSKNTDLTALGLFVGTDAAVACLALNDDILPCSLLMGLFHAAFLYLGAISAKPSKVFGDLTFLSGAFLFALGIKRAFC